MTTLAKMASEEQPVSSQAHGNTVSVAGVGPVVKMEEIQWPAPASYVALGHVVDLRNGVLGCRNVFGSEDPSRFIKTLDITSTKYHSVESNNIAAICSVKGIHGDAQLSLVTGIAGGGISGHFLNSHKNSAASSGRSMIYSVQTKHESIDIGNPGVIQLVQTRGVNIASIPGTHVVVGIGYGGEATASYTFESAKDDKSIGVGFSAKLIDQEVVAAGGSASYGWKEAEGVAMNQVKIDYSGDFLSTEGSSPANLEEFKEFAHSKFLGLLAKCNGGKGVPKTLYLVPLQQLELNLQQSVTPGHYYQPVECAQASRIIMADQKASEAIRQLNDFSKDAERFKNFLQIGELVAISKLLKKAEEKLMKLRDELCRLIVAVHGGQSEPKLLNNLCKKLNTFAVNISNSMRGWLDLADMIKLAMEFTRKEINIIGRDPTVDVLFLTPVGKTKSYWFYFSQNWKRDQPIQWANNMQLFLEKWQKKKGKSHFFAVRCDLISRPNITNTCVQIQRGGRVVELDLLGKERFWTGFKNYCARTFHRFRPRSRETRAESLELQQVLNEDAVVLTKKKNDQGAESVDQEELEKLTRFQANLDDAGLNNGKQVNREIIQQPEKMGRPDARRQLNRVNNNMQLANKGK